MNHSYIRRNIFERWSRLSLGILLSVLISTCAKVNVFQEPPDYPVIDSLAPSMGKIGMQIRLYGSGFSTQSSANTVTINGVQIRVDSPTTSQVLLATITSVTGTGHVGITVNNQKADGPIFTYDENAIAIINISPTSGWVDSAITIRGVGFGKVQDSTKIFFGTTPAIVKKFSDTLIVLTAPDALNQNPGTVPVTVVVSGKTSNSVSFTYSQRPVITGVVNQPWRQAYYYWVAATGLSQITTNNKISVNGHDIPIDSIIRQGTAEYNQIPIGEKIAIRSSVADQYLSSYSADFIVTTNNLLSDVFHFENNPRIENITATARTRYSFGLGDTVVIDGKYFGANGAGSIVELWDSVNTTYHFNPDPTILSWNNSSVSMVIPNTYVFRQDSLRVLVKVKENGKEADAYATLYNQQQQNTNLTITKFLTLPYNGVAVDSKGNVFLSAGNNIFKAAPDGTINNFAGNGSQGHVDGNGSSAQFDAPFALTVDRQDNIYVTDALYGWVRKISPAADVTTLLRMFEHPELNTQTFGIASDASANLFVAGNTGNFIFEISSTNQVQKIAGNGTAGYIEGTAANAEFHTPTNVGIDEINDLYVVDQINNVVRKITFNHNPTLIVPPVVSTVAGDGNTSSSHLQGTIVPANQLSFYSIRAVASDLNGNIYIADQSNIYKLNVVSKSITVLVDNSANFSNIKAIAFDIQQNRLYVCDAYAVYKISF